MQIRYHKGADTEKHRKSKNIELRIGYISYRYCFVNFVPNCVIFGNINCMHLFLSWSKAWYSYGLNTEKALKHWMLKKQISAIVYSMSVFNIEHVKLGLDKNICFTMSENTCNNTFRIRFANKLLIVINISHLISAAKISCLPSGRSLKLRENKILVVIPIVVMILSGSVGSDSCWQRCIQKLPN